MSDKYQNKYRSESARLQNWDYGSNGRYFVTICTHNRACFFGKIVVTNKMILSETGEFAHHFWNEIPHHFPFVELGEFVVMPNHVHGIIIINKPPGIIVGTTGNIVGAPGNIVGTPESGVPTILPPVPPSEISPNRQQTLNASAKWKPATLGVIVNQYKRMVTINARKIQNDFAWQSRFYDNIIWNDDAFRRISNYIQNNPLNWAGDKFYEENVS